MQKLLRNGILVTDRKVFRGDLLIDGEKIAQVATSIDVAGLPSDVEVIDLNGKLIMPGIIDAHTHYELYSRNTVTADDFYSGTISAACGGVTTFVDYADHLAGRPLREAVAKRMNLALGKAAIDFTLHQTITHFTEEVSRDLAELRELGINSIKIFTTYRREGYLIPVEEWEQVFLRLKEVEILLTVHAEDDDLVTSLEDEYRLKGHLAPAMHAQIRPAQAEGLAVSKVGALAAKVGIPVYIAHLSSEAGLQALRAIKAAGGKIHAETTPHYLVLTEDVLVEDGAQKFIMTPPLRKATDNVALWAGLKEGDIEVVATDHCAFNVEQKLASDNCLSIFPGLPGSETLLPIVHHFGVGAGHFDLPKLVQLLSTNPAKIFGMYPEKGSLEVGTDADIVIFDPEKKVNLTADVLHSAAGYSPYEAFTVQGYPVMTFLRGELIMSDGHFTGEKGQGKFVSGGKSVLWE